MYVWNESIDKFGMGVIYTICMHYYFDLRCEEKSRLVWIDQKRIEFVEIFLASVY